jgi:vacuolar-type H+-ATPase subunit I/STV1
MTDRASAYVLWIVVLAAVSLVCTVGIVWGEVTGHHRLGGALIGVILLAYSFILLCLRKGGFTSV